MNGNSIEATREMEKLLAQVKELIRDVEQVKTTLLDEWSANNEYIDATHHIDIEVVTSVPNAGDLEEDEIQFGDGTGPNGRDEIFFSVDGSTVARVEADSVIT